MNDYTYRMALSCRDELEKISHQGLEKRALSLASIRNIASSAGRYVRDQAGAAGAGAGLGAGVGALGGAGVQGVRGYQEAKEQGAGTGQALLSGAVKGLGGAVQGAGIGGAVGGGAGMLGGQKARDLADKAINTRGPVGLASRFGQRQLHSVTGYAGKDPAKLKAMRAGSWDAQQRFDAARRALQEGAGTPAAQKSFKEYERAHKGLQYAREAEQMGLTSLPGYLKSLATNPVKTLKTGFGEQWHGQGPGMKALTFGLPVAMAGAEALQPSQEGGPGRAERALRGLAGGLAFGAAPIPLAGSLGLTYGAEQAAGLVGAGIDRRRRLSAMQQPQQGAAA